MKTFGYEWGKGNKFYALFVLVEILIGIIVIAICTH